MYSNGYPVPFVPNLVIKTFQVACWTLLTETLSALSASVPLFLMKPTGKQAKILERKLIKTITFSHSSSMCARFTLGWLHISGPWSGQYRTLQAI